MEALAISPIVNVFNAGAQFIFMYYGASFVHLRQYSTVLLYRDSIYNSANLPPASSDVFSNDLLHSALNR